MSSWFVVASVLLAVVGVYFAISTVVAIKMYREMSESIMTLWKAASVDNKGCIVEILKPTLRMRELGITRVRVGDRFVGDGLTRVFVTGIDSDFTELLHGTSLVVIEAGVQLEVLR